MVSDANKIKIGDEVVRIEEDHTTIHEVKTNGLTDDDDDTITTPRRDRFIIEGKTSDKFDHNEFSKWLLNESGEHFTTIEDTNSVYYYKNGIYVGGGEAKIEEMVERVMDGYLVSIRNRSEVVGHVRALTHVSRAHFDTDPNIINMSNGLYHVTDGRFEPHRHDYLSLSKMVVDYDPRATCPIIDGFVKDVADPRRIQAIYEIAGYAILPRKRMKRGVIFVGPPNTGKTTMTNLMGTFVGEDRVTDVSPITIGGYTHATYELYGKLLNRVDDLGETPITETGVLKSILSSGPVWANQKYGNPFSFRPNVLVIFGCNKVPTCPDKSMMDKFDILEFMQARSDHEVNMNIGDEMTTPQELSGLFNKAMAAIRIAIKKKTFDGSFTLADRQKAYEYLSNPFALFVNECCKMTNPEAQTDKELLRKVYVEWSKERNSHLQSVAQMTTYLKDQGVMVRRVGSRDERTRCYEGIELLLRVQPVSKVRPEKKPTIFQEQYPDPSFGVHIPTPIVTLYKEKRQIDNTKNNQKDVEKYLLEGTMGELVGHHPKNDSSRAKNEVDTGWTPVGHGHQQSDIWSDLKAEEKLKHAIGKAIAKSGNFDVNVSEITQAYPGGLSVKTVEMMLNERGDALGFKRTECGWMV